VLDPLPDTTLAINPTGDVSDSEDSLVDISTVGEDAEVVVDPHSSILLQLESRSLHERRSGLHSDSKNDEVCGKDGTILEEDRSDRRGRRLGGLKVVERRSEVERDALRLVELDANASVRVIKIDEGTRLADTVADGRTEDGGEGGVLHSYNSDLGPFCSRQRHLHTNEGRSCASHSSVVVVPNHRRGGPTDDNDVLLDLCISSKRLVDRSRVDKITEDKDIVQSVALDGDAVRDRSSSDDEVLVLLLRPISEHDRLLLKLDLLRLLDSHPLARPLNSWWIH
jgi:hypothetical protein